MAQFKKGKSGNPKGRPRGNTGEKTKYIRDWLTSLIGSNAQSLTENFKNLPSKDKWRVITQLMPYVIPKQTETKLKADVNFSQLSDEQIDCIIGQISENILNDE